MSRLDSFIRRLEAQRACLARAVELVAEHPGPVLEMGLGNGRTYDHLREICPERDIYVFERQVAAHPDCIPPDDRLLLGDLHETLPAAVDRFRGQVALIHSDVGSGDVTSNAVIAEFIGRHVGDLLAPGGVLASDQLITFAGGETLDLPEGVRPGRYFLSRRA